ncbi:MAG: hypothetical protein M2R45_05484 [Verrucomicrobia subdivision 3 bacterium]|nr:hypothetical protein [Limisphaerales bacterium]
MSFHQMSDDAAVVNFKILLPSEVAPLVVGGAGHPPLGVLGGFGQYIIVATHRRINIT